MSTKDVMSTVGTLTRRVERLERHQKPKISGGGSGAPDSGTYITVADEAATLPNSRQLAEGADIDITDSGAGDVITVKRAGNKVLLYDAANDVLREYEKSNAGILAALSAAASGDVVELPPGTYTGDVTVPAGITLRGCGWDNTIIAGQVILGDGAVLIGVKVYVSESSSSTLRGIKGPDTGSSKAIFVWSQCINTGSGAAYAACSGNGALYLYDCRLNGETDDIE